MTNKLFIVFLMLLTVGCGSIDKSLSANSIKATDRRVCYIGRIGTVVGGRVVYWPGSDVVLRFRGSFLRVKLRETTGKNYFDVIIDSQEVRLFRPKRGTAWFTVVRGLKYGVHQVQIYKRNEFTNGATYFYGFETDSTGEFLKAQCPKRNIEFYGNSITAGFADRDSLLLGERGGIFTDNYVSYGSILSRHYNAGFWCIARSGIGLMISWTGPDMRHLYYRLNPLDSASRWNFSRMEPQLVVINLLQNDYWLLQRPQYPSVKKRFKGHLPDDKQIVGSYYDFLKSIREHYPNAEIICVLGPMSVVTSSRWRSYVCSAVAKMRDKRVHYLFLPYLHRNGHPKVRDHRRMAKILERYIDSLGIFNRNNK